MRQTEGFTIVELLVTTLIFAIILTGIYAALLAGQSAWSMTDTQIRLQENLRETLHRVAMELEESGEDLNGVLQVTIGNNTGTNNTDLITFSVPMCVCSNTPLDANGEVTNWGAPLSFGKTNCPADASRNTDGTISICHVTSNPVTQTDTDIAPALLDTHLAHGDWLGACAVCSVNGNKFIEYAVDANNQLLRRVRNNLNTLVKEETVAHNVSDFQAVLSADQNIVILTVTTLSNTTQNRQITATRSLNVRLKNKG